MSNKHKENSPSGVRSCEFVSRLDKVAEAQGCDIKEAKECIIKKVKSIKFIKHYAAAVHDQDRDEYGVLIKPHIHMVLELKYPVKIKDIAAALGMPAETVETIRQKTLRGKRWVADVGGALSYLTHRNAPEKYQYEDSIVLASPDWDWKGERAKSEKFQRNSDLDKILMQIADGTIDNSNLADSVDPRFYVIHKRDIDAALAYRRLKESQDHSRNMIVMFIHGEKGTGKTTIAKQFCESKKMTYFISGGNNDVLDGYAGEEAIILDDVRPWTFEADEWLKILDNYTDSLVRSRYHNKRIKAQFVILTSTLPLEKFGAQFREEDPKQLYRRIKIKLEVTKDHIEFYEWRQELDRYVLFDGGCNPILKRYGDTNLSKEQKRDIVRSFLEEDSDHEKSGFDIDDEDLPF